MNRRRFSRPRASLAAAALLSLAAALAGCYQYRYDDQGRVIHVHTDDYRVYNQTVSRPYGAGAAITDWHDKLAGRGSVTVSNETAWGNTKGEAILWEVDTQDTGAALTFYEDYHENDGIAVVIDKSVASGWTYDQTQKRICDAIGNVLGLADNAANDINNPDDCMKPGGSQTISSDAIDAVVGFFGYGPEILSFGGKAYDQRTNLLTTGVYPVTAEAGGHGLTQVALYVDVVDAAHKLGSASPTSCATQTTAGNDNCEVQVSGKVGPLSAGQHTIYARATNEFSQVRKTSFTVTARKPAVDWGFNEGWGRLRDEIYRTGQNFDPGHPAQDGIGATSNRFGVQWRTAEPDPPQPDPGAPPNPDAWTTCTGGEVIDYSDGTGKHCYKWTTFLNTYQAMRDAGQRPVLNPGGAPEWARQANWNATPCSYDDGCVYPPASGHDNDWRDFVRRAIAKFPEILAVEVWNEPNFDQYWFPTANAGRYSTVLGKACEGVKKAYGGTGTNCDAGVPVPVVTGGLSPGASANKIQQKNFLEGVYANGGAPSFQGIGSHIYPGLENDYDPDHWQAAEAGTLNNLGEARTDGGDTATSAPFWVTEIGVATCQTTDPETGKCSGPPNFQQAVPLDRQGPILAAMYDKAVRLPDVKVFLVHRYKDNVDPLVRGQLSEHMGVVNYYDADKPGYSYLGCFIGDRDPFC